MKLTVKRYCEANGFTIGKLSIDDVPTGFFTLEPPVRADKPRAIPLGLYKVILDYSNKFKRWLPHVLDVEDMEGIRIHPGNTSEDTLGCILIGKTWDGKSNFIGHSREAFDEVLEKIKQAQEVSLEVV